MSGSVWLSVGLGMLGLAVLVGVGLVVWFAVLVRRTPRHTDWGPRYDQKGPR